MHDWMKYGLCMSLALAGMGCWTSVLAGHGAESPSTTTCQPDGFPRWTFSSSNIFPPEQILMRPEDGKALPDGRIVVADQTHGLLLLDVDGSHRPFGQLHKVGYSHDPPKFPGGPNGVYLEHDMRHILMVDIYTGRIYRVDTETEEAKLIYDHPYGVNNIHRDSKGTLWFTQSTSNGTGHEKEGLWDSVNLPVPTGSVFKLKGSGNQFASELDEMVKGLYLANGITMDLGEQYLYVSESMMDRVLRFSVNVQTETISDRKIYQMVHVPDNLAIDPGNNLWIASFVGNRITVVDHKCQAMHTVFHANSRGQEIFLEEWVARSHLGKPRVELLTPAAYLPLPSHLTGLFFSHDYKHVYFTGLGNAILKFSMDLD